MSGLHAGLIERARPARRRIPLELERIVPKGADVVPFAPAGPTPPQQGGPRRALTVRVEPELHAELSLLRERLRSTNQYILRDALARYLRGA